MERTNIERAVLIAGAVARFSFAELLETQAADVSTPENSSHLFITGESPSEVAWNALETQPLPTTPEPTAVSSVEIAQAQENSIDFGASINYQELFDLVAASGLSDSEKQQILDYALEVDNSSKFIASITLNLPIETADQSVSPRFSITEMNDGSSRITGLPTVTSESPLLDATTGNVLQPGSVLFNLDGHLNTIAPPDGQNIGFAGSTNPNQTFAVIEQEGVIVQLALWNRGNSKPVFAEVSELISGTYNEQGVEALTFWSIPVPSELKSNNPGESEVIPSLESLDLAMNNPEVITMPELIGNPTFITQAEIIMPNGSPLEINIYGDIQKLKQKGFRLFQYSDEEKPLIQEIANEYLMDSPNVIPVLSVNERIYQEGSQGLQDGNTINGISHFNVDLSKGVTVVLTEESLPESVSFSAYVSDEGSSKYEKGVFIEPRTDGRLVMYVNLMGLDRDLSGANWIVGMNYDGAILYPLGYIRFSQNAIKNGRTSQIEMSSDFYNLRRNAIDPVGVISKNIFANTILPIARQLSEQSYEIS